MQENKYLIKQAHDAYNKGDYDTAYILYKKAKEEYFDLEDIIKYNIDYIKKFVYKVKSHGFNVLFSKPLIKNDISKAYSRIVSELSTEGNIFTNAHLAIYQLRKLDLQQIYSIQIPSDRIKFLNWCNSHGIKEYKALLEIKNKVFNANSSNIDRNFGVNLIGYAYGEFGIGEDIRMLTKSCISANIPFSIINFDSSTNARCEDLSIKKYVTNIPKYPINIICLTAMEHLRYYLTFGEKIFKDRYNIGYWPWELKFFPKNYYHCFQLVNELWASSKYILKSLIRVKKELNYDVPIKYMPMAVSLPDSFDFSVSKDELRSKFNLPKKGFLFIFAFDGNSSVERKNPFGVLHAFLEAVGKYNAFLIIKCMNVDESSATWKKFKNLANKSKKVIIINKVFSKIDTMYLFYACDCFISLHRAEGFGRCIAEAILLNLKIIASCYGGNIDFCPVSDRNIFLVPCSEISLNNNEYMEGDGNIWGNPDINYATSIIRNIIINFSEHNIITNDKNFTNQHLFDSNIVGNRYKKHLLKIYNKFITK